MGTEEVEERDLRHCLSIGKKHKADIVSCLIEGRGGLGKKRLSGSKRDGLFLLFLLLLSVRCGQMLGTLSRTTSSLCVDWIGKRGER